MIAARGATPCYAITDRVSIPESIPELVVDPDTRLIGALVAVVANYLAMTVVDIIGLGAPVLAKLALQTDGRAEQIARAIEHVIAGEDRRPRIPVWIGVRQLAVVKRVAEARRNRPALDEFPAPFEARRLRFEK